MNHSKGISPLRGEFPLFFQVECSEGTRNPELPVTKGLETERKDRYEKVNG